MEGTMINDEIIGTVKSAKKNVSYITVVGVGGAGGNAVEYMYNLGIDDVEFMVCNTDLQALNQKPIPLKVALGTNLTGGLGAGASPKIGQDAAIESEQDIRDALAACQTKMAFITAGMGGGTGTGAAPVIARIAREMGILTVGIVTMPLQAEARTERALAGLAEVRKSLDAILVIDNEAVFDIFGDCSFKEAFGKANEILATAAKSIADIIIHEFHMNIDFADVKKTIADKGVILMGTHTAKITSEDIVSELMEKALSSPLLMENNISGATNLLVSITWGGEGLSASKVNQILIASQRAAGGHAELISGIGEDRSLAEDEVKLTIIATGFDKSKGLFQGEEEAEKPAPEEKTDKKTTAKTETGRDFRGKNKLQEDPEPIFGGLFGMKSHHPVQQSDEAVDFAGTAIENKISKSDFTKFAPKSNIDDLENIPAYLRQKKNISHKVDSAKKRSVKLKIQ